jgi:hypothetical protein
VPPKMTSVEPAASVCPANKLTPLNVVLLIW